MHLGKFYANQELSLFSEFNGSNLPPLGSRVRRGPDWKWANQDQGGAGTVVGHASSEQNDNFSILVPGQK